MEGSSCLPWHLGHCSSSSGEQAISGRYQREGGREEHTRRASPQPASTHPAGMHAWLHACDHMLAAACSGGAAAWPQMRTTSRSSRRTCTSTWRLSGSWTEAGSQARGCIGKRGGQEYAVSVESAGRNWTERLQAPLMRCHWPGRQGRMHVPGTSLGLIFYATTTRNLICHWRLASTWRL